MLDTHKYIHRYCLSCGFAVPVRLNCGDRLCPLCKQPNYFRLIRRYVPVIKSIPAHRLSQVTLTFKNFPILNKRKVLNAEKCFRKLRSTGWFKERVNGGLAVFECKHVSDEQGWNLHMHVLVNSSYISVTELSMLWRAITGDSFIVDVRKEENNKRAVFHLLKYFLKQPVIEGSDIEDLGVQFNSAFFGSRNIISFGSLYDVKGGQAYEFKCPSCGALTFIDEFEMIRLEARALPASSKVGAG